MKYSLKLTLNYNEKLNELFKSFKEDNDRIKLKILKKSNNLVFDIKANDSVALRAILNSITKLFTVYEKLEKIGK
ncbi:MAG: KEOPS complex subunit Pcc1 [Candidatus Woesearchaeota archaeon]